MDIATYLMAGLFGLALAGTTFGACRWHYGRRMRELLVRIEKLEYARQTSIQHALQARRQVEALQKELAALRSSGRVDIATAQKRQAVEAMLRQEPERQTTSRRGSAAPEPASAFAATQIDPPAPPTHGFAETLPMCVRPGTPA